MSGARKMDLAWLTACALQMGLLSGCGNALSQPAGTVGQAPERSAVQEAGTAFVVPVRISRNALSQSLSSDLQIQTGNGASPLQWNGSAGWSEGAPDSPAPDTSHGVVLADFRDRTGCVANDEGATLCFKVQPDVDSVAANASQMTIQGIESLVPASCRGAASHLALQKAEHGPNSGLIVHYTGSDESCTLQLSWTITPSI